MGDKALKIHIIDDDIDDVFLIEEILKEESNETDFEVSHSGSISEGITQLKKSPAHVVLLDLSLPDATGFEGLKRLRAQIPSCNIVILTGLSDREAALNALKRGASDFLSKNDMDRFLLVRTILHSYERQKLEDSLRQSQKLEAIGQMAGGIAHDFNNQLGILSLLVGQLEDQAEGREDLISTANDMSNIIEKCAYMTRQILGFSRKQALFPQAISLNRVVEQVIPFASRMLGSDVQLDCDLSHEVESVYIDRNQLEQVLWNVILNAKQALTENKKISIRTRQVNPDEIKNSVDPIKTQEKLFLVEIEDTGSGIAPEILERVFDPFFTTKPQGTGTGLGLSTALGFVRQSGGYMAVHSELGKGTCFQILFPMSKEKVSHQIKEIEVQNKKLKKPLGVLICDDEPMLRKLIASSLEDKGFLVFEAGDGAEGFDTFHENQDKIDLIVTDLTMPKLSGAQMIQRIQKIRPELPCIFMTGFSRADVSLDIDTKNIIRIEKPFSMNSLITKAFEIIDEKRL